MCSNKCALYTVLDLTHLDIIKITLDFIWNWILSLLIKILEKKQYKKTKTVNFLKISISILVLYWLGKIHSLCTVCRILNNLCSILYGGRNWCRLSNELTQQNCSKILHCTVVKGVKLTHSITAWSRRRYRYLTTYYILY